jgi:glycosyltransferase involved in cell wall biosynthesis
MKKLILIIDLSFAGHHSIYMENIALAYLNSGCKVIISTLDIHSENSLFLDLRNKFPEDFNTNFFSTKNLIENYRSKINNIGRELLNWFIFKQKYNEIILDFKKIDYVFIPYVDCCIHAVSVLGSPFGTSRWGGICMQSSIHHKTNGFASVKFNSIKNYLFFRFLKTINLTVLFTIDELLIKYVNTYDSKLSDKIKFLPDAAELIGNHTYYSARQLIGIPKTAIVILLFGDINIRKGLDILVKALSSNKIPIHFHLLVVGDQDNTVTQIFESKEMRNLINNNRVFIKNQFVDKYFQQLAFAATDIVWLGYREHLSMSGVLVLSAISRKVVVATDAGLIGWYTRNKNLGLTVNIIDIYEVEDALLELSQPSNLLSYKNKISNYFDNFTWLNATKIILSETIQIQ